MADAEAIKRRQRLASIKARQASAVPDGNGGFMRSADDFMRAVASGMTFGLADEAAAVASTAAGVGGQAGGAGDYESNLAAERARDEAIPLPTRLAGEITGGITTGAGLARGVAAAAPKVAQAFGKLPGVVKAGTIGGAYGGGYGAGSAEGGATNRLAGAGTGATLGAATGAVAYPIMKAGEAAIRHTARGVQNRMGPQTAGQRKILQAIGRDEMTPGKVSARLRALGPQATLADAGGENLRGLARAAAGVPGPAKNRASIVLNQRAEGESARLVAQINKGLKPKDYFAAEDEFLTRLRTNANELYTKAYQSGPALESKRLTSLLNRPIAQQAMKEAAELASIEGRRVSQLAPDLTAQAKDAVMVGRMNASAVPKGGVGRGVTTEAIDDLKRGIDSIIDRETNQFTGGLTKRGKAIADFKRVLLKEADRLNPAYANARMAYAGDAEVVNALRLGRDAMKWAPEEIKNALGNMSSGAQQAFRSGAARTLKDTIDSTPDMASASRRLFGKSSLRKKLRAIFPDDRTYNGMARALLSESRFSQTRNTVLGGSPTAPRLAEQADIGVDPGIVQGAVGPASFAGNLARAGYQKLTQPNPGLAKELSGTLFNRNQSMNQGAIDAILRRQQLQGISQGRVNAAQRGLLDVTTQQEGLLAGRAQNQR